MLGVLWMLIALTSWDGTFEGITHHETVYQTRHECVAKRSELLDLAERTKMSNYVAECVPLALTNRKAPKGK